MSEIKSTCAESARKTQDRGVTYRGVDQVRETTPICAGAAYQVRRQEKVRSHNYQFCKFWAIRIVLSKAWDINEERFPEQNNGRHQNSTDAATSLLLKLVISSN